MTIPTPAAIAQIIYNKNHLQPLEQEDRLDLELSPLDETNAAMEVNECNVYFRIGSSLMEQMIDTIPFRKFDSLFNEATLLKNPNKRYFTGIKIYYGIIDGSNKITPIFAPVIFQRNITPPFPEENEREYTISESANKYIFNGTSFVIATASELAYKANYTSVFKALRPGSTSYSSYIAGTDATASIFPFQTIYTLENDNEPVDNLLLYNSVRKTPNENLPQNEIQHCIILSPDIPVGALDPFKNKFANRSHLCPPDCVTDKYIIL